MRTSSRAEYLRRIDRIVARLATAIATEEPLPSVAELASVAHFSQFHFMRVYRALTGEALGQTIQRLRLIRAVHLLTHTAAPVTVVSGQVGFETPQSFAKAFRRTLGMSPTQLRESAVNTQTIIAAALRPPETAAGTVPAIRVDVVHLEPFKVAAIRNAGAYSDLDRVYGRLIEWLADQHALEHMTGIWGVPHHDRRDTPPEHSVFDCCVAIDVALDVQLPIVTLKLGGGQYLSYHHTGSYQRLDESHDLLLHEALLGQDLVLREAPIIHRFLNDPEETPEPDLQTTIFIPVQYEGG
jgi:AraC family transcriptional regulator